MKSMQLTLAKDLKDIRGKVYDLYSYKAGAAEEKPVQLPYIPPTPPSDEPSIWRKAAVGALTAGGSVVAMAIINILRAAVESRYESAQRQQPSAPKPSLPLDNGRKGESPAPTNTFFL